MNPKLMLAGLLAFTAALVLSIGLFENGSKQSLKDTKAQYLQGGDFSLSNEGETFRLQDLRGQVVILYFGYTYCPDVCPLGLTVIRDALNSDTAFAGVPALFVTLDPARDTKARLNEYTQFFHPNIRGLTGSLEEIQSLAKNYGTYFKAMDPEEGKAYTVDHTAYFYLISEEGELMRVLDHNTRPEALAEALKTLL